MGNQEIAIWKYVEISMFEAVKNISMSIFEEDRDTRRFTTEHCICKINTIY